MWKTILDILFPITCLGCGQAGSFLCSQCLQQIPFSQKQPYKNLIITSFYDHPLLKEAILNFKYNFVADLAKPLACLMIKQLNKQLSLRSVSKQRSDLVVRPVIASEAKQSHGAATRLLRRYTPRNDKFILIPVPLTTKRLKWRGFNQSALLASEISQQLNIPLVNNLLIRIKHNLPQVKIADAQKRKENIKKAFCLNNENSINLKNKTIILVDDVCTTGATLNEAAQTLKHLKPKNILGLVLAKG